MKKIFVSAVALMAALSLYVGFRSAGVDGFAHLGGFLGGALLAAAMKLFPGGRKL